jgi:hypothetical protein
VTQVQRNRPSSHLKRSRLRFWRLLLSWPKRAGVGGTGRSVTFLIAFSFALTLASCGSPSTQRAAPLPSSTASGLPSLPTATASPSPSSSPTSTADWRTYVDERYGFTVRYPPDFAWEHQSESENESNLRALRFVDRSFLGNEPPGQIEIDIFKRDSEDLDSWVSKHSAAVDQQPGPDTHYSGVSNRRQSSVAGISALAFEADGAEVGTVHHVAFFYKDVVADFVWFAGSSYSATLEPIFEAMLSSFKA